MNISFSLNDTISFRLTERSADLINEIRIRTKAPLWQPGDLYKMQAWEFMRLFGPHVDWGSSESAWFLDLQLELDE